MRVVILAGGLGTRLSEETDRVPKPMVEIGAMPMLWHIMKTYDSFDLSHFVVALGYKGDVIKRFFIDYRHRHGDITVDLASGAVTAHDVPPEDWTIDLVETGLTTATGGRFAAWPTGSPTRTSA